MSKKALFIAATGQNVGKTTLCLGMLAELKKRLGSIGFIKPVGQRHEKVSETTQVDKDVILFKKHFNLDQNWEDMSPVIIPSGYTRDYIDGKFSSKPLLDSIETAFSKIHSAHPFTLVEGTGHVGVGTIIDLNNAKVAKALDLEMVIIAIGGLGSAIDELALNLALCKQEGIKVRGVILNKVLEEKKEMLLDYFPRCLKGIPLLGLVPYSDFLSNPTMRDFEMLFNTNLLSGQKHHYRHFQHTRLAAGSLESFAHEMIENELVITPANREEIIQATLDRHVQSLKFFGVDYMGGMILTGQKEPSPEILAKIRQVDIPVLYAPIGSFEAMKMITSYIAKIRTKDTPKIEKAIELVSKSIDFDRLLEGVVKI